MVSVMPQNAVIENKEVRCHLRHAQGNQGRRDDRRQNDVGRRRRQTRTHDDAGQGSEQQPEEDGHTGLVQQVEHIQRDHGLRGHA